MNATATHPEPTLIASHKVQARFQAEWFAFTGNPHYAYLSTSPSVYAVQVHQTINGEFYVSACFAPEVQQVHALPPCYRSNGFATLAEAQQDANRVWLYLRDEFVSDYGTHALTSVAVDHQGLTRGRTWIGDTFGAACPLPDGSPGYQRQTLCPACQHFGTLVTSQQAYGDSTTCTTPGCTYSTWYSIGD